MDDRPLKEKLPAYDDATNCRVAKAGCRRGELNAERVKCRLTCSYQSQLFLRTLHIAQFGRNQQKKLAINHAITKAVIVYAIQGILQLLRDKLNEAFIVFAPCVGRRFVLLVIDLDKEGAGTRTSHEDGEECQKEEEEKEEIAPAIFTSVLRNGNKAGCELP